MTRLMSLLAASSAVAVAMPAVAQDHSMHDMPGMSMPAARPQPAKPKPVAQQPAPRRAVPVTRPPRKPVAKPAQPPMSHEGHDMEGMDHSAMPGMDMQGDHADQYMKAMPAMEMTGTALPAGDAPAPKPPSDHYADRRFPAGAMEHSRHEMMKEQGGQSFSQIMFNLAEVQARQGRNAYRWDGEGWFGGDIHRLTIKSEGEGVFRGGVEAAEVQALYSRAIGPYFNLQAGIRHDFKPKPSRTYAALGFEGLAPYWFEVEGAAFISNKGDVLGRIEGYYDQRITQRLVLQPRVELNFAAQDVPEDRIGAGLSVAELGLRLRYEVTRRFAPYFGISYEAKTGRTARYARADGGDPTTTSLVAGIRIWF